MSASVRAPAVAGQFYPGDEATLRATVDGFLAGCAVTNDAPPKAIVAPHAGYMYSGAVAASAYATVAALRDVVRRVVLLGPAHRAALDGIAAPTVDAFRTPLGDVVVDTDARAAIVDLPGVVIDDAPHAGEHSLEVHLPFLQRVLTEFRVLPLVVGHASAEQVAAVLDRLWGGDETLIVVSSDLSHYEADGAAHEHDRRTADSIIAGDGDALDGYDACGVFPLRGLLVEARRRNLQPQLLDLRTSGDTAGGRARVVGYGAFAFTAVPELCAIALDAIRAKLAGESPRPVAAEFSEPGAAFVTLERGERLLGCVGSLEAVRPLGEDVARHAVGAAFADPRVPPITVDDYEQMCCKVSVLSPMTPVAVDSFESLARALRPGVDGLLIAAGSRRATFLPSVWAKVPDVATFLDELWRKAGLQPRTWPSGIQCSTYTTEEHAAPAPRPF